jgi:hypothetical protein
MKVFVIACIAAVVIATGGGIFLNTIQKESGAAFTTSGTRL